jgi:hypothetical protein
VKIVTILVALFIALCVSCGDVGELRDNADASDTDTDADCDEDGGMGDCGAPWGWYDEVTGLCWELPPFTDDMTLYDAEAHCEAGVSGGHCDWRLPTISELRSAA